MATPLDDSAARAYDAYSKGAVPLDVTSPQSAMRARRQEENRKTEARKGRIDNQMKAIQLMQKDLLPPYVKAFEEKTNELVSGIESGQFSEQDIYNFVGTNFTDIVAGNNMTKQAITSLQAGMNDPNSYIPYKYTDEDGNEMIRPLRPSDYPQIIQDIASKGSTDIDEINNGLMGALSGMDKFQDVDKTLSNMQDDVKLALSEFGEEALSDLGTIGSYGDGGFKKFLTTTSLGKEQQGALLDVLNSHFNNYKKGVMGTTEMNAETAAQDIEAEFDNVTKNLIAGAVKKTMDAKGFRYNVDAGPGDTPEPLRQPEVSSFTVVDYGPNGDVTLDEMYSKSTPLSTIYEGYKEAVALRDKTPEVGMPEYAKNFEKAGLNAPDENTVIETITLDDVRGRTKEATLALPGAPTVSDIQALRIDGQYYLTGTQIIGSERSSIGNAQGFNAGAYDERGSDTFGDNIMATMPYFRPVTREQANAALSNVYDREINIDNYRTLTAAEMAAQISEELSPTQ